MCSPANIGSVAAIAHTTAFKPGQSDNPRGRSPGTRNRVTIEAQLEAAELVDDPEYRAALRQRMIAGTAGAMEPLVWFYAKGTEPTSSDDEHVTVKAVVRASFQFNPL